MTTQKVFDRFWALLEEALSDPVYADEDDISSWADDEVDAMSVARIFLR